MINISVIVLGSEKIRHMKEKMKTNILNFTSSPAKTLQNELCLMKIGLTIQKLKLFKIESRHVIQCNLRFSNCSTKK